MRLLLDTHIVLGIINERTGDFPKAIQTLLGDARSQFFVSVASLWEVAIKWRLGKLELACTLEMLPALLVSGGLELVAITTHHVLTAVHPEPITRDPFDRLLLAQCYVEHFRLVTIDRALLSHELSAPRGGF